MSMIDKVARAMAANDSGPEGSALFEIHWREFGAGYRDSARVAIEAMHIEAKVSRLKIAVCFEQRPDGGLRAYSQDVPGLVLSSMDVDGVLADVTTALQVILSARLNVDVQVTPPPNKPEAGDGEE